MQEFVAYCNNAIWKYFFNSCSIIWNNCLVSIYEFFNQIKCTIWLHTRYANYSYWRTRIYYTVELEEIFRSSDKGVPCGLRNFSLWQFLYPFTTFFSIICAEVNLAYMCGKILHLNISCKKMFHQHSRNKVIIEISWCCWLVKLRKSFTRFSFGKKSNKVKRESLINIDDICLFVMVVLLNSHIHNIGNYMGKIST